MSKLVFTVEYSVCIIIQILVPTYAGSLLHISSESLPQEVYKTNWLNKSHQYKMSMMILVSRTLYPLRITAGSIFELSLTTLLMVSWRQFSVFPMRLTFICILSDIEDSIFSFRAP